MCPARRLWHKESLSSESLSSESLSNESLSSESLSNESLSSTLKRGHSVGVCTFLSHPRSLAVAADPKPSEPDGVIPSGPETIGHVTAGDRSRILPVQRWVRVPGATEPDGEDSCGQWHGQAVERDALAVEEPLEIRVAHGPETRRISQSLSITMRTPGDDFELAVGFLLSEGVIRAVADLQAVSESQEIVAGENLVRVSLAPHVVFDPQRFQRHFYTTSSCGLCGKASLEALAAQNWGPVGGQTLRLEPAWIGQLPAALRRAQRVFDATGGLHASALFPVHGELELLREDVGRHNALDKVLGRCLLDDRLPAADRVLVVSGRVSLELLQKAVAGGVPVVVGIGAPSSLAVECAETFGVTLVGFASDRRFNCYAHPQRIG